MRVCSGRPNKASLAHHLGALACMRSCLQLCRRPQSCAKRLRTRPASALRHSVTAGCSTAEATTCGVAPPWRSRHASAAPVSAQLLDSVPQAVNTTSAGRAAPTSAASAARASSRARLLCAGGWSRSAPDRQGPAFGCFPWRSGHELACAMLAPGRKRALWCSGTNLSGAS